MDTSDNQATPDPVQSSSEDNRAGGVCWWRRCTVFFSSFMKGETDETVAPRVSTNPPPNFTLATEAWRFIAYCFFWAMVTFAVILTRTIDAPKLAAGPDKAGDSCGPFNRENPGLGVGFDFDSQTHVIDLYEYSNISAYWDYSMFYPLAELSLATYIVLDFLTLALAYQRGDLTEWFWNLTNIFFPIQIILCALFRGIFNLAALENMAGHAEYVVGLQVALVMISIQNFYILHSQVAHHFFGGLRNIRILAIFCLICNLVISGLKVVPGAYVLLYSKSGGWFAKEVATGGSSTVDLIWMVLNAVIPMIVSYFRAIYLEEASADM